MKSPAMGWFAVAAAIVFVGGLWLGVPLSSLVPLLVFVACPVMMFVMMRGMHDDHEHHAEHGDGTKSE